MITPKCRSRKHKYNGCLAKNCPEGLSIPGFVEKVKNSPELLAQIAEDGVINPDYRNILFLKYDNPGWHTWVVKDKTNGNSSFLILPPDRPEVEKAVDRVNKTLTPSFTTMEDLSNFVEELYGRENVTYRFIDHSHLGGDSGALHYTVADLYVQADLRGKGIGSHVLRMVNKYADENNLILDLVPSEVGAGNIVRTLKNEDKYETERRQYHIGLKKFYTNHGYVANPGYHGRGTDLLTGERFPIDTEFVNRLNRASAQALENGLMVRFPNNKIPKTIFGKKN